MRFSRKAGFLSLAMAVTLLSVTHASGAVPYALLPGSNLSEGCVPPCRCPVWTYPEVTGTFILGDGEADPLFISYPIEAISWTAFSFDGEVAHEITGSGVYRIGGEWTVSHQLVLDVSIDGGEPEHLDSGLVPMGTAFPSISVHVSRGTECRDIWMDIEAAPASLYLLGRGSVYTEGCVPPCDCPTWMGKARGWFFMSPSGSDPLFQHYAVEEIRWFVFGVGDFFHRITGRGTYSIGGEVAIMHRLELDLSIDGGEPEHLDSGFVDGGTGFPRQLSISLARGTPCWDIEMDVAAYLRWGPDSN